MSTILDINKITIRRNNKIYIPTIENNDKTIDDKTITAFISNLYRLGYVVNKEIIEQLSYTSIDALQQVLDAAEYSKGDHFDYEPMYPNFPKQVAEASEIELYLNAMMHYSGDVLGVRIMPVYDKFARPDLDKDEAEFIVLGLETKDSLTETTRNIITMSRPFSQTDKEDIIVLKDFVKFNDNQTFKVKENLVFLTYSFPDNGLEKYYKTAVDVLRLAAAYSNGDITLATPTKFKLSRPQRRMILQLLDNVDDVEGMGAYSEQWKRLARTLHYRSDNNDKKYPTAAINLEKIQTGNYTTVNSKIEKAIEELDIELLEKYPGIYARRILELLRKHPQEKDTILQSFSTIVGKVSVPVLLGLYNLLRSPGKEELSHRLIRIKNGEENKTFLLENRLSNNDDLTELSTIILDGIEAQGESKKVVFSKDASHYAMPLYTRNISKGSTAIGLGSRLPLDSDKNTIRLFMHWKDFDKSIDYYDHRVDLDLSAIFLDNNFDFINDIAYYNVRIDDIGYHSGDITSAPEGASEFIDININKALDNGIRYVVPTIYNYTQQPLNNIPESFTGFMMRDKVNNGEIFEPSTIKHSYDLNNGATNNTPYIIDLKNREIVWLDTALKPSSYKNYNVANNIDNFTVLAKYAVLSKFMTVEEYFSLTNTIIKDSIFIEDIDNSDYLSDEDKNRLVSRDDVITVDPSNISEVLQFVEL
mgnify:FL=1